MADSRNGNLDLYIFMIGCFDQSKIIGEDRSEMTLNPHVTHLSSVCKRALKGYLEKNHLGVFDWGKSMRSSFSET